MVSTASCHVPRHWLSCHLALCPFRFAVPSDVFVFSFFPRVFSVSDSQSLPPSPPFALSIPLPLEFTVWQAGNGENFVF